MKKYNYTEDDLRRILDFINKRINEELDEEVIITLKEDKSRIFDFLKTFHNTNENYEDKKLMTSYYRNKMELEKRSYLWPVFEEFHDITNQSDPEDIKKPNISLSKTDILDFTHDFYKSIDTELFHKFMMQYKQRKNHVLFERVRENTPYGDTLFIESERESFIRIYQTFTTDDLLICIHEYAHAISFEMNPENNNWPNYFYTEIIPNFFQLLATDYMNETLGHNLGYKTMISEHNHFLNEGDIIYDMLNIIKGEKLFSTGYKTNKDIKHTAFDLYKFDGDYINSIIRSNLGYDSSELISYIYALELYNIYKDDKEKALAMLKELILLQDFDDIGYYEKIKRLGMYPNLSLKKHHNNIVDISHKF